MRKVTTRPDRVSGHGGPDSSAAQSGPGQGRRARAMIWRRLRCLLYGHRERPIPTGYCLHCGVKLS